jgi:membrane fusion protein (multidrug efflux system)
MKLRLTLLIALALIGSVFADRASAQAPPPPAVGVVKVDSRPVTESTEFVGRIQAVDRVDLVARITGFLEERLFNEGAEVQKGDLLFRIERGPFEADLQQKTGSVGENNALLTEANNVLNRARTLLNSPAGQRATVEDSASQQLAQTAKVLQAQAALKVAQINLDYTEIKAPISGKISRALVTPGNVVSPTSGPFATIVSQDPMYVLFPVSSREEMAMLQHYADKGGLSAVRVKVRHQDGRVHPEEGLINYVDPTVSQSTDTITLRASIPNPATPSAKGGATTQRDLVDGEFVTVIVQGAEPVQALSVPRPAVLTDQNGSYVWVVDAENKAQKRPVKLGPTTAEFAAIYDGLKEGETVIAEGMQRARPGLAVNPGPMSTTAPAAGTTSPSPAAKG